uniref:Claudin n=1 Tax=Biomphalaria glabrata TaxID=6526 RepID=A0A2C9L7B9_BIOGL
MPIPSEFNVAHGVGAICVFIGVVLHIIGLATPNWTTATFRYMNPLLSPSEYTADVSVGLWMDCDKGGCSTIKSYNLTGAWRAAGAFAILGMLSSFVTLAVAIVHIAMPFFQKLQFEVMSLVTLATSIATVMLIIICVSCFGGGVHNVFVWTEKSIGYSLVLSIIGGIVVFLGGVIFYIPRLRKT